MLIGPYDLSASLGKIGQVNDGMVKDAINKVSAACQNANVKLGIFGVSADAVSPYQDAGFTLIVAGVDTLFMLQSAKQTLAACRGK